MASSHTVLRKFDVSDSWESYSRELEQYFEVNNALNDTERVAILLTVLSSSVYEVLRDFCRPELPRLKTYAELSELLKIHHSPQPSVFKERIEFYRATQTRTESVSKWLQRVIRLAVSCDFGTQLDTMLKDNFVSGLADGRVVRKLCEGNSSPTLGDLVDSAEKYALLYRAETGILDLPDEVLNQIILLLTPRERVPLGNSCRRLKTLVFEDPELLRHLDFSEKVHPTTMSHIQQYFNNENPCQHILRVDASNVYRMKPGELLNNSIGRAINLVELNIHGTRFRNLAELDSFLKPLQHLEKLSIDLPRNFGDDISLCKRILRRPFRKLTYLSVGFENAIPTTFPSSLSPCQQLKELRMQTVYENSISSEIRRNSWNHSVKQLTNLKIIQYSGHRAITIKEELVTALPDPKRWTDFQLCSGTDRRGFYIEKDVEVCKELLQSRRLQDFLNTTPWDNFNLKWALNPECLLKEVLGITHEDVPENLCCLSTFDGGQRHLLNVEEAKLLLKDPRYKISHLYVDHELERHCDAHLLACAFPNLSELVLHAVTKKWLIRSPKDPHLIRRRLSERCSPTPEKLDDSWTPDSSFKMLVENTPHLRHFTLGDVYGSERTTDWDLGALCLISGWRNLETLHMTRIPCKDGKFLIEIAKQCKNLRKLFLRKVWSTMDGSDKFALFKMFEYCRNLQDLTIWCDDIDQAEMFATLAKNVKLERFAAYNYITEHSAAPWISSLENLVRQCEKLTTIICDTKLKTRDDCDEVKSAVKRIKGECRRPDFEIAVTCRIGEPGELTMLFGIAFEDLPHTDPFLTDLIGY